MSETRDLAALLAAQGLRMLVPPGKATGRSQVNQKGVPTPIYRKVWVDRDKYSPIRGMKIGNDEEAAAEAGAEGESDASGPAFS